MSALAVQASRNVRDTLAIAMEHVGERSALLVADDRCELSRLLAAAYSECLPGARVIAFDQVTPEAVKAACSELNAGDLAVLIQSSVFRLPEFRTRVELFRRDIKVIEHCNLERIQPGEVEHYVAALAYDPQYYRGVGHALKARMDAASSARIESLGETLLFDSPLELAKLNIGDFSGLKNTGSMFPIGEVFTEARDLERVSGRVNIYGFADTSFLLNVLPD